MKNEKEIIRKCREENLSHFSKLYEAYVKKVYDFIYYKTCSVDTAEDLTSLVFLKALESITGFDEEAGTFQSWIYRIAGNTVVDFYRKKKELPGIDDLWDIPAGTDLEVDSINSEMVEAAKKLLSALPAEKRDIVIMRVWQNLSYKEIAEITGKSEANCKMIFSRTISAMREAVLTAVLLTCFSIFL